MQDVLLLVISFVAAIMDYISCRVRNWLIIAGLLLGIGSSYYVSGVKGVQDALFGIMIPVLILFPLFLKRYFGAGDIKLLCVAGSFLGPVRIFTCICLSVVMSGAFGLAKRAILKEYKEEMTVRFAIPVFFSILLYRGGLY